MDDDTEQAAWHQKEQEEWWQIQDRDSKWIAEQKRIALEEIAKSWLQTLKVS